MQQRPKTGYTEGAKGVRFGQNATTGTFFGAESASGNGLNMQRTHEADLVAY